MVNHATTAYNQLMSGLVSADSEARGSAAESPFHEAAGAQRFNQFDAVEDRYIAT